MSKSFLLMFALLGMLVSSLAEAADWPTWRGSSRDGISKETGLLQSWPAGGPEKAWTFNNAGLGYSSFAIADGVLYTLGTRGDAEILFALEANTGKEKWALALSNILENGWGNGPRATPTVADGNIYVLSGVGTLVSVSAAGKENWKIDMADFGGRRPNWGYCESVTVDGDKVICTPGGAQGSVLAVNRKDGSKIWQSSGMTDGAQYASLVTVELGGVKQYIQMTHEHVFGIVAETGKLAWKSQWEGRVASIPTPIVSGADVYITSGYGVGCKLLTVNGNQVTDVYRNTVMKNHHGGVVKLGDYLYGYSDGPGWICQNFKTGEMVWNNKTFGKGAVAFADGRLYAQSESTGEVVLLEPSPEGYKEHGKFILTPQSTIRSQRGKIWTHPVISNGKLYIRDQDLIHCYNIAK